MVEEYDSVSDTWQTAPMPTGRILPRAAVVGAKLYVIGGVSSNGGSGVNVVEEYDPATNMWVTRTPMPTPRYYPGVAGIGARLYVVGGNGDLGQSTVVEEYTPSLIGYILFRN